MDNHIEKCVLELASLCFISFITMCHILLCVTMCSMFI